MRSLIHTSISTFTGFGDEPDAAIKFGIDITGLDQMPDWSGGEARLATFAPLHSNDVVTQYRGRGPRELTVRLWFACRDDLELLDSVQGRSATLRYVWGVTSRAGGHKATLPDGVNYLVLPDTVLVRLSDQATPIGGTAQATATFRRAVGIGTLFDYAYYTEDEA